MYIFKYLRVPARHLRIAFDEKACCLGYGTAVSLIAIELDSLSYDADQSEQNRGHKECQNAYEAESYRDEREVRNQYPCLRVQLNGPYSECDGD